MSYRVAICIPTYKRPDGLRRLLDAIAVQQIPIEVELKVIVVDNEDSAVTKGLCGSGVREKPIPLIYCVEPRRGLSFVRNKAFEVASEFAEFLIFVDDDERPLPNWLEALVKCQQAFCADAVSGPVVPYFMSSVPNWIRTGRFFDRTRHVTGTHLTMGRTGNVLLRLGAMKRAGGFDARYAFTGGEDTEFFRRFHARGCRIVWCDEAVVEEWLPPTRTRLRWLLQRAWRTGCVDAGLASEHESRAKIIFRGFLRASKGAILLAASVIQDTCQTVRALQRIVFAAGMVAGAFGHRYEEYRKTHAV